jgi:hypothetical protein
MARYIDADKFKSNLEKTMEKMHLIGGVKGVDVGAVIVALDRQPTADVVPREEVDRARLQGYKSGKKEVAREIFEDIDNALIENFHADCQTGDCIEDYYDDNLRDDIFKIKKKYTEEKKDEKN